MMDRDERQTGGRRRGLRERHADKQRADEARTLRDGDRTEVATSVSAASCERALRRRRRCRGRAGARRARGRRRPTRDEWAPAMRRHSTGWPTAGGVAGLLDHGGRGLVARCFDAQDQHAYTSRSRRARTWCICSRTSGPYARVLVVALRNARTSFRRPASATRCTADGRCRAR